MLKKLLYPITALVLSTLLLSACEKKNQAGMLTGTQNPQFYSKIAREVVARFHGQYRTNIESLEAFSKLSESDKRSLERYDIPQTLTYLFGPLTHREIGGSKRDQTIKVDWSSAKVSDANVVELTYSYEGTWILSKNLGETFEIPVPYNTEILLTPRWKNCSDRDPEHQTESFFWYFWDPERTGCDHHDGIQYQTVAVTVGNETLMQTKTFPEYQKMIQSAGIKNNLQMTFAFGYVEERSNPNPDTDSDAGAWEYQKFIRSVQGLKRSLNLTETPILEKEYLGSVRAEQKIGARFTGEKNGVKLTINVVAAGDIDQMELFAKSFAHDHDGFFGWFGHSRVGSGFDANNFKSIVDSKPDYYSISKEYQMIYWAGCNSYSYYSLPFFKFKADLNPSQDPNGTLALDILGNGLPSYFSFNADNARVALTALLDWEHPTSYQALVDTLEDYATERGQRVLVNILGDEDNSRN